jgi:hypothetical protein
MRFEDDISLSAANAKPFDLNIEKILEDWEVYHALREVIANALDEQLLTSTRNIEIMEDSSRNWHIKDYGRGLRHDHLTQNENAEKLSNPNMIGKFGIGLKDALATFDRHRVKALIKSKHGDITLGKMQKHGFEDITTLHAYISPPSDPNFIGTEFILSGVTREDVEKAKDLFLKFSGETSIERVKYGEVLRKKGENGRIYINGVKVAEEENFLFSYNITSVTEVIKRALNRERSNVGRTAYSERIRTILLSCSGKEIAHALTDDLKNFDAGTTHGELEWKDVQEHAVKILNSLEKVVFLTPSQMINESMMVDEAKAAHYQIITIPESLRERIHGLTDVAGNPIRDLGQFVTEYHDSFQFKFVDPKDLKGPERKVFEKTDEILGLIGGKPKVVKEIRISETMRQKLGTFVEDDGLWEPETRRIIIKRSALKSLNKYAGTLLHEVSHALSGAEDVSREFELKLTDVTGTVASEALE